MRLKIRNWIQHERVSGPVLVKPDDVSGGQLSALSRLVGAVDSNLLVSTFEPPRPDQQTVRRSTITFDSFLTRSKKTGKSRFAGFLPNTVTQGQL